MIVFSLVVKSMNMRQRCINLRIDIRKLLNLAFDLRKLFEAIMMQTEIVLLLSLCNRKQEIGVMLVPQPSLGLFEEVNGILNRLILPTASDGDDSVLDRIEFKVQTLNHLAVHLNQLIAIITGIERQVFHVVHEQIRQLMPHLGGPECAQLHNLGSKSRELGLVLVKNGVDFVVGDGCHQLFFG